MAWAISILYKLHLQSKLWIFFLFFFVVFFKIIVSSNTLFHMNISTSGGQWENHQVMKQHKILSSGTPGSSSFPAPWPHIPTSPCTPWRDHPQQRRAGSGGHWHYYFFGGVCLFADKSWTFLGLLLLLKLPFPPQSEEAQSLGSRDSDSSSSCRRRVTLNAPHCHSLPTCPRTTQFPICKIGKAALP